MNKIFKGIAYRLRRHQVAENNPYQLTVLKEIILKHQEPSGIRNIRIGRHRLFYENPLELYHSYKEIFLQEIYDFVALSSTPTIIDCGANMGIGVCYFSDKYPGARIIAFEPDSKNFELLKRNVPATANITLNNQAVWIDNGAIHFEQTGTLSSKIAGEGNEGGSGISVPCVRLADQLTEKVDMLKIDIEGAEYEVLKDCIPYLNNVANMFVEYHGTVDDTGRLTELLDIMKNAGFCVYIKMANDLFAKPFIEKRPPVPGFEVQLNIFCYRD